MKIMKSILFYYSIFFAFVVLKPGFTQPLTVLLIWMTYNSVIEVSHIVVKLTNQLSRPYVWFYEFTILFWSRSFQRMQNGQLL